MDNPHVADSNHGTISTQRTSPPRLRKTSDLPATTPISRWIQRNDRLRRRWPDTIYDIVETRRYNASARLERFIYEGMKNADGVKMQDANDEEIDQSLLISGPTAKLHSSLSRCSSRLDVRDLFEDSIADQLCLEQERRCRRRQRSLTERFHRQLQNSFLYWIEAARSGKYWIQLQHLPQLFRFVLRRPLMPELEFRNFLRNIGDDSEFDYDRNPFNNVERKPSVALYASYYETTGSHVSSCMDLLPKGYGVKHSSCLESPIEGGTAIIHDESPCLSRRKLCSSRVARIEAAPSASQVQDRELEKNDEHLQEVIEDLSNAITLFRNGTYSIQQTVEALLDCTVGLVIDLDSCLMHIKDLNTDPRNAAIAIVDETFSNQPSPNGSENNEDEENTSQYQPADETKPSSHKPKLSIKYDIASGLMSIYLDFLEGLTNVRDVPEKFRSALDKPDMPDWELSSILAEHDIPPELFFTEAMMKVPATSLSTSKLRSTECNAATRQVHDPLRESSKSTSGPGKREILIENTPPSTIQEEGEAETPASFEYDPTIVPQISGPSCKHPSISMALGTSASISTTGSGRGTLPTTGDTSPTTDPMPRSTEVQHISNSTPPKFIVSPITRKKIYREDYWPKIGTAGYPTVDQVVIDNRSISPEDGVTEALWGLPMPTRLAREWCQEHNLPTSFIQDGVKSTTPQRRKEKKASKLRNTVCLVPPETREKRRLSLSSAGSREHKHTKYHSELAIFAEKGETQESFVARCFDERILHETKAAAKLGLKQSRNRCWGCGHSSCRCRDDYLDRSSTDKSHRHIEHNNRRNSVPARLSTPSRSRRVSSVVSAFGDDRESLQSLNQLADAKLEADIKRAKSEPLTSNKERLPALEKWKTDPRRKETTCNTPPLASSDTGHEAGTLVEHIENVQPDFENRENYRLTDTLLQTVPDSRADDQVARPSSLLVDGSGFSEETKTVDRCPGTATPVISGSASTFESSTAVSPRVNTLPGASDLQLTFVDKNAHTGSALFEATVKSPGTRYVLGGGSDSVTNEPGDGHILPSNIAKQSKAAPHSTAHKKHPSMSTALGTLSLEPAESSSSEGKEMQIATSNAQSSESDGFKNATAQNAGISVPEDAAVRQVDVNLNPFLPPTPRPANISLPQSPRPEKQTLPPTPRPANVSLPPPSRPRPRPRNKVLPSSLKVATSPLPPSNDRRGPRMKTTRQQVSSDLAPQAPCLDHMDWDQTYEDLEGEGEDCPELDSSSDSPLSPPPLPLFKPTPRPIMSVAEQLASIDANVKAIEKKARIARVRAKKAAKEKSGMKDMTAKEPVEKRDTKDRYTGKEKADGRPPRTKANRTSPLEHLSDSVFLPLSYYCDQSDTSFSKTDERRGNSYFQSTVPAAGKSGSNSTLNKLFDKYRDDPSNNPDVIGTTGTMKYLMDLGVQLDEPATFAIHTELSASTVGELSREGFISGWKALSAENISKQQAAVANIRSSLTTSQEYFQRVYKYTFLLARTPGQKNVALDAATEYWRLLFGPGGNPWATATTNWLTLWIDFLLSSWKKSVGKDMWDQTGVFAKKCLEDESMSWWSEDGAWPGVLDDFVAYVREKRHEDGGAEAMVL